jgi:hypothetical protein
LRESFSGSQLVEYCLFIPLLSKTRSSRHSTISTINSTQDSISDIIIPLVGNLISVFPAGFIIMLLPIYDAVSPVSYIAMLQFVRQLRALRSARVCIGPGSIAHHKRDRQSSQVYNSNKTWKALLHSSKCFNLSLCCRPATSPTALHVFILSCLSLHPGGSRSIFFYGVPEYSTPDSISFLNICRRHGPGHH